MQAFLRHLKWPFFFSFSLCWSFPSTEYRWIFLQYLGGLVHYNQEIHFWNKVKLSSQHLLFPNHLVGGLHRKENTYFWNPEKTLWREQKCCWLKKWQIVSSLHHPKTILIPIFSLQYISFLQYYTVFENHSKSLILCLQASFWCQDLCEIFLQLTNTLYKLVTSTI